MSETVLLSEILKKEYVSNYISVMKEHGKSENEIMDSIVDMLFKIEAEEGGTVLKDFMKILFRGWVKNNV